jgi:DHA1 family multidrug resistance protein-like MFS transporter
VWYYNQRQRAMMESTSMTSVYSRTVFVIGIVQLIESLAFSLPLSYFPNYALGLGASVAFIGVFTSSFALASAIMSPKMGAFSDQYGRKKVMIFGLIGDVIIGASTGLAPSWLWLLLIRIINGVVSSATMLAAEALLMDSVPSHQWGEATGFATAMGMIGRNAGPVFGGTIQAMAESQGVPLVDTYRIPYFVDAVLATLALGLVLMFIQETRQPPSSSPDTPTPTTSRPRHAAMSVSFKTLLVYSFVNGIGVGFIVPIMALFYVDKFGIEPLEIGMILSFSGFIGLCASWLAGRVSDRIGRKPLIVSGSLFSRLFSFLLPLTGDVPQASVALSLRSLGFNISMPALRALRADLTPPAVRGHFFGLFMTAFTAGDIIGPLISTYLYDMFRTEVFAIGGLMFPGYGIPFFVQAILGVASTLLLQLLVVEPQHAARERGNA